ncbi:MAG: NAD(P)H-dependent oxidoreductase [Bacteroidota bacterium]
MKKVLIIGSSRKDGNTRKVVDTLHTLSHFDIIDLNDFNIQYYDYKHRHHKDDFLPLIRRLILDYDTFIFATPVYWYAMSGILKVFFDRITDLLDTEKELGRKLRTKNMAVLSSSVGDHLGETFWIPFQETAKYLGMNYLGHVHTVETEDPIAELTLFAEALNSN